MPAGGDFVAEFAAHPALLRAFQTNKRHIQFLHPRRSLLLQPIHGFISVSGFLAPKQRCHAISRSHLCVAVARMLTHRSGTPQQMRRPPLPVLLTRLLSRMHVFAATQAPRSTAQLQAHADIVFCVTVASSAAAHLAAWSCPTSCKSVCEKQVPLYHSPAQHLSCSIAQCAQ